ncbi:MAG: DUF5329 domain-containing protein [Desulforhopalus sp.]
MATSVVLKMIMVGTVIVLLQLLSIVPAAAAKLSVEEEIDHLIGFLEQSACQFNRNGTWYNAAKAGAHIRKKYRYLKRRGLVGTTELFIERAASKSSMSGKAYLVRCSTGEAIESATWFRTELARLRQE